MAEKWKKQFVTIYIGQAFSLLGSSAVQFSVIWWLTVSTESAVTLTLASIAAFLPSLLIGPFAGVWIDRYNRRAIMIAADALVALSSAVLGAVFLLNASPPVWIIYIILFIRGVGNTFHGPAMQAAIPTLVPADMLTKAGGWGSLINSLTTMAGPALGAVLMSAAPMAAIMLVDIFGAAFAIICLLFVRIPDIERTAAAPHVLADVRLGLRAVHQNKPLFTIFIPIFLVNLLFAPLSSLFPLLIRTHFLGEAWHTGVAEFAFAGGLLISSLIVGIWGGMKKRFLMISLAVGLLGATALVSGAAPLGGFWVFVLCCFFMGGSSTFLNVPLMAYVQQTVAPDVMGKVFSLMITVSSFATPIGLLIAGPASEIVGIAKWFAGSGAAIIAVAILCRVLTRKYDTEIMAQ